MMEFQCTNRKKCVSVQIPEYIHHECEMDISEMS
jgi:hypothetical protein